MTVFGGFITGGTVSTDPSDATKLTFSGIVINGALGAVAGDTFSAGGYQVPIASIDGTGAATLVYAFPVALDDEADYAIVRDSAERYNPAATNLLVRQYLAKIADASITYVVPDNGDGPTDLIAPDPQEGQKAIRFSNPWRLWLYTEGAWVEQPGSPGGPGPQGEAGATWLAQDAEPTTDYPPNSLWVDTDSAGLDVYELSGSPLNWVSLGFGLKGPQGGDSTVPGPQGPIGPAFEPDEVVPNLAGRDAYDDEVKNFSVLVEVDSSNSNEPTLYFKLSAVSADWSAGFTFVGGGGSGDVVGPSSSTDAHIVLFDGATGKAIKDSGKAVGDFATSAQGVSAGGTTGQVLAKASGADNDTQWIDPPGGGAGGSWNRNLCTNPAMQVWQNDTTLVAMGHRTVLADGWLFGVWSNAAASSSVWTATRSTDVPDSSVPFSLSLTAASAETPLASTSERHVRWAVYGREFAPFATSDIKVRFWVKAKKTGVYSVACLNEARTHSYINEYTVNVAETWEEKTVTIPFGSKPGTWNLEDGYGFGLRWSLGAGTTFQTTAGAWQSGNYTSSVNQVNAADASGNYIRITKVQVCPENLTDFELPSYETVLSSALRQYRIIDTDVAGVNLSWGLANSAGNSVNFEFLLSPPMMAAPSVSVKGVLDTDVQVQKASTALAASGGTLTSHARSRSFAKWSYDQGGRTPGDAYIFRLATTSGKLVIDGHLG